MVNYKIGNSIKTKYVQPITGRYIVGQKVDVFNNDTHKKVATFEVVKEDGVTILGQIINTYGHKRFQR